MLLSFHPARWETRFLATSDDSLHDVLLFARTARSPPRAFVDHHPKVRRGHARIEGSWSVARARLQIAAVRFAASSTKRALQTLIKEWAGDARDQLQVIYTAALPPVPERQLGRARQGL